MKHDLNYYRKIQGAIGVTSLKEAEINQRKAELSRYFENSLDCDSVTINGTSAQLVITKSTDLAVKNVVSKPDETLYLGDIIRWIDTDWIVDAIDADTRINTRGKMRRCNVMLKWLDENGTVRSYSGFCEDATKYSEGVSGGKMIQVGDFQIKVKIHLDAHSAIINRDKRFLLDMAQFLPQMEATGSHPSAYVVTRRNVLTGNHAGHGYMELTMVETAYSENDNPTLMIADFYAPNDVYELTLENADGNLTVAKDSTYSLSCSATKNGVPIDQTSICYQSSDTSIATVSTAGVVKGVANGTCVVTVKAGNAKESITITVEAANPAATIKIFADADEIIAGQTLRVLYAAYQNGLKIETALTPSISGSAAEIESSGDEYVIIRALDDAGLGASVALTVSSEALGVSAEKVLKITGWF